MPDSGLLKTKKGLGSNERSLGISAKQEGGEATCVALSQLSW